ncbi:MAG: hypothetical protein M3Z64_08780 [Verrucomicrobiota bacterium]|nr:hypothetical protein [Verrucomicrobiota bacterium]
MFDLIRNALFVRGAVVACFAVTAATAVGQENSATPTATPAVPASPSREVRITFLPPPLEGTISLGIFDGQGKLVRVLHREAELAEFTIGNDALSTTWDGKNDAGDACEPGKYRARGYAVGDLEAEDEAAAPAEHAAAAPPKIVVKLIANPLVAGKKPTVDLAAGFDEDGTFLQTADGLPLFTVDETSGILEVSLIRRSDKAVALLQNDGDTTDWFRIRNIDQMMAFDCGEIQLK